nr:MAG TPA: hypothetical protein [Caudoviricetes sp.]
MTFGALFSFVFLWSLYFPLFSFIFLKTKIFNSI